MKIKIKNKLMLFLCLFLSKNSLAMIKTGTVYEEFYTKKEQFVNILNQLDQNFKLYNILAVTGKVDLENIGSMIKLIQELENYMRYINLKKPDLATSILKEFSLSFFDLEGSKTESIPESLGVLGSIKNLENILDKKFIDSLISLGADVNYKDNKGISILRNAVRNKKVNLVEVLLELGADPDSIDNNGNTNLASIIRRMSSNVAKDSPEINIVKLLIKHKAQITEKVENIAKLLNSPVLNNILNKSLLK